MQKDKFGCYEVTFYYNEPANKKNYEFRKYVNSKNIKKLGGMYALYCEEDSCIIFRKSEYLRDRSYKKFSEGLCKDSISCSNSYYTQPIENTSQISNIAAKYDCSIVMRYVENQSKTYNLPHHIDKSKLTEEEFQTLRKLIKKGLS